MGLGSAGSAHSRFELFSGSVGLCADVVAGHVDPMASTPESLSDAAARLLAEPVTAPDGSQAPTVLLGVVPFEEPAAPWLYRPRRIWCTDRPTTRDEVFAPAARSVVRETDHEDIPSADGYADQVRSALTRIDAGQLEKIVLSRRRIVRAEEPWDVEALRGRLLVAEPEAHVFRVDLPTGWFAGDGVLLGASPELLLRIRDGWLTTHPLAGTAVRTSDLDDDRARAELLGSAKDLHEHQVVVREVVRRLRPFVEDLEVPEEPSVTGTAGLWHLGTQIRGRLRPGAASLEVLEALHPTPAVCGQPHDAARALIRDLEGDPRGPYAGAVGWMREDGDCEWVLGLRCAVVDGAEAVLHAGAGIVAGSDPCREVAETDAKLAVLGSVLSGGGDECAQERHEHREVAAR